MKRFLTGFLVIILVVNFVCCAYFYGEDKQFSTEIWLNNIIMFGEIATLEDVITIWTDRQYDAYAGDNQILHGLDSIRLFFVRLYDTIVELIHLLADIFRNMKYLLPWNAVPGYGSDASGTGHGGGAGWVGGR